MINDYKKIKNLSVNCRLIVNVVMIIFQWNISYVKTIPIALVKNRAALFQMDDTISLQDQWNKIGLDLMSICRVCNLIAYL